MAVLIPFTSGVESTYLVEKALKQGNEVLLAYFGVTQNWAARVVELTARRHMINIWKEKYPSARITEVFNYDEVMTYLPNKQCLCRNGMRQQWMVVRAIITAYMTIQADRHIIDAVWLGWADYDMADHSFSYTDISLDEYQRLCKLVPEILTLSNIERNQRIPFMPIRHMTKRQVWEAIDDDIKPFIVCNNGGDIAIDIAEGKITAYPIKLKVAEYKEAGIPVNLSFDMVEFSWKEQALMDFAWFEGLHSKKLGKYHGYANLTKDFQPQVRELAYDLISNFILSLHDRQITFVNVDRVEAKVKDFVTRLKGVLPILPAEGNS